MYDIKGIEESSIKKKDIAIVAKTIMEGMLKEYTGKYLSFNEVKSFCKIHKMTDPEILLMAWDMLIKEHQHGKPFITSRDVTFGKRKPLVSQKEIFVNGKFVLHIGLRLVE